MTTLAPTSSPAATLPTSESFAAFDTETLYGKDYSVRDLGPIGYTEDPRFDCYLVSFVTDDGFEFTGHPKDCPWERLRGKTFLSHNSGFDRAVLNRLIALGIAPDWVWPKDWHCTANLCVYFGLPRSLAGSVEQEFGVKVDKTIRDKDIKGKHWDEFGAELQAAVLTYALDDARWCLKLWQKLGAAWPERERIVSYLTYSMGEEGLYMNATGLENEIALLERAKFEAAALIPWSQENPILSPRALAIECRKNGIEPPKSLAKDSVECEAWEDTYGAKFPWVDAMRTWRRCNALSEKFKTALERIRPETNRMPYSMLYFGASTGRWSGTGGFNIQNMGRDPIYFDDAYHISPTKTERFADLRSKIIAAPGKKLVVSDFSQIEARITPWLAGDRETIKLVAAGDAAKRAGGAEVSIYEVHARASMDWTGGVLKKEDPLIYLLAKCRVLGLGFGCGWFKFISLARKMLDADTFMSVFGKEVSTEDTEQFFEYLLKTDGKRRVYLPRWESASLSPFERRVWVNSWLQVTDFREKNPKIVKLWRTLDDGLKRTPSGTTYVMELPSGRELKYFDVTNAGGQFKVRTTRGGHFSYAYGGLLTENCLTGDNEVLTPSGWKRLDSVETADLLWDGIEFVSHDGLVAKGVQPVIDCHGVLATPDHKFLVGNEWVAAECIRPIDATSVRYIYGNEVPNTTAPCLHEGTLRSAVRGPDRHTACGILDSRGDVGSEVRLRSNDLPEGQGSSRSEELQQSVPGTPEAPVAVPNQTRDDETPGLRSVALDEAALRGQQSPGVSQLRRAGDQGIAGVVDEFCGLLGGHGADLGSRSGFGPDGQRSWVFVDELSLDDANGELPQQAWQSPLVGVGCGPAKRGEADDAILPGKAGSSAPHREFSHTGLRAHVYDVLNCGPRHRFAVRPAGAGYYLIAHNCVQATARDVLVEALVRLNDAGIKVLTTVHDEVVCEVDEDFDPKIVADLMTINPSWAKSLPLAASYESSKFYLK